MKGTLKVHSENILPIIKKWLYSDKDIFLRELVSNASDALFKRKVIQKQEGLESFEEKISIHLDKEKKTLTISDTGIGMTEEEVEKYIAQVAFSGAKEFAEKYEKSSQKDQIIGHFGLGFFSAFMVSKKVELVTLSHEKGASAVCWSSDGSSEYEITQGEKETVGTSITLFIDEDSLEYLEEKKLVDLLKKYCSYLPYPIYFGETKINPSEPLFAKLPSNCSEEEYKDFYRQLYPNDPEPLFWVHIHIDVPFHLKGVLFFPKIHKGFDFQTNTIKLFCNRVFVSDNCKDLLPDYLMILKGAMDSPDIPLNVSRSYLQMDKTVRSLGAHIAKKIAQKIGSLHTQDKEKFLKLWPEMEMVVKLGVLQDEKMYDKVKDFLVWNTLDNDWVTIEELKEKEHKTIYYTTKDAQDVGISNLYKEKGLPVILTQPMIDNPLMQRLEEKLQIQFKRIDSSLEETFLDTAKEKTLLDAEGKSGSMQIADFIRSTLSLGDTEVEAKSLSSEKIPALFVIDEQARRFKEFMMTHAKASDAIELPQKKTFVVNTNNALIEKAFAWKDSKPELAKKLVEHVYDLARLSQKEISAKDLSAVVERSQDVLEALTSAID